MNMNALSNDLRKRIVEYYETISGASYASTAHHFMVGEATVSRLVRHWRKTGKVEPNKPKAKERTKINIDWLRNQFANKEDKLLKDIVLKYKEEMNITVAISSIWYALQSIDLSHKKNSFCKRT